MDARDQFIIDAYRLSRHAPHIWREFEASFIAYVATKVEESIQASPDIALIAHGRAQSLVNLRNDFKNIENIYVKITKAK